MKKAINLSLAGLLLTASPVFADDKIETSEDVDTSGVSLVEPFRVGSTTFASRRQYHEVLVNGLFWLGAIGTGVAWHYKKSDYEKNLEWYDNTNIARFDELTDQHNSVKRMGLISMGLGLAATGFSTYLLKKYNVGPFGGDKKQESKVNVKVNGKNLELSFKKSF